MSRTVTRLLAALCRSSAKHTRWWLVAIAVVTLPAIVGVTRLRLDTNLVRLLPNSSRAANATRNLETVVGGTSYAVILFEGDDSTRLIDAVTTAAIRAEEIPNVASVQFENPVEFIDRYRYLLIPSYYLEQLNDLLAGRTLGTQRSVTDPTGADERGEQFGPRQDRKDMNTLLNRYKDIPRYHQSEDGRVIGLVVRASRGVTSLGASRRLFSDLETLARQVGEEFGLWSGVAGSLRNKIEEYDVVMSDLRRSGLIAATAILLTLLFSFRSVSILPVLLAPLGIGLTWAFALVPLTVGSLNLITSFLLIVMFGMGVDYALHLVKRFQYELLRREPLDALLETFVSTGTSVMVSGVTTALSLFVLAISDFKGFSEFGFIGGMSILIILAAMFLVMPAVLAAGSRIGMVKGVSVGSRAARTIPGKKTTMIMGAVVAAGFVAAATQLEFDYDFDHLSVTVPQAPDVSARSRKVFTSSRSPAAVFVAPDLAALDEALDALERRRSISGSTLGRIASIRDLAPTPGDATRRLALIDSTQRRIRSLRAFFLGRHATDLAADMRAWERPERPPTTDEVPETLQLGLRAKDGSGRFLAAVYPYIQRRHGINAMAFTEELYSVQMPTGVLGPVGETPVLAEILWLVTREGPGLVALALIGVFVSLLIHSGSLAGTMWMLFPLATGMALALGAMGVLGIDLNFFNVVIIPPLIGLGVDHGVHYYRHWRDRGHDVASTQSELLGPLSVCSATTIMGYAGMIFSTHRGLESMGLVACLGLAAIWLTSLVLLPGVLRWRGSGMGSAATPIAEGPRRRESA